MSLAYVVLEQLASRVELEQVRLFAVEESHQDAHAERSAAVRVSLGVELMGQLVHQRRGRNRDSEEAEVRVALSLHVLVDDALVSGPYARLKSGPKWPCRACCRP